VDNQNYVEEVRLAWGHLRAPGLSHEDKETYIKAKNLRYSRMGVLVGDSSGLDEEVYLSDYQVYARWLLGQFREFANTPTFVLPKFVYMDVWLSQAERLLVLATEMWREVPDFPNYAVSSYGRVKNVKSGRILKHFANRYKLENQVDLSKNGKPTKFLVHRLVAQVFLDDFSPRYVVLHKSDDKKDNRVVNLKMSKKHARLTHSESERQWQR
jgi:hypothetical protein